MGVFFHRKMIGFVVCASAEKLEKLRTIQGFGCYIGKEGYAYVDKVSDVIELTEEQCPAMPSTLVPADDLILNSQWSGGCDIYNLYRYRWQPLAYDQLDDAGVWGESPTAVDGFIPFTGAYYSQSPSRYPVLRYWTNQDEIFIPDSLIQLLRGNSNDI